MADLSKRIRKILKKPKNAVVLGNAMDNVGSLCELFSTVFIINGQIENFRKKNIIYRENFEGLENISEIDFVFVDKSRIDDIYELRNLIKRQQPYVLTEDTSAIRKEHTKFFREYQYQVVDIAKRFYIWKNNPR